MVCEHFSGILRAARPDFNARFAEARVVHPNLDARVFTDFLSTAVDRLVGAVADVRPECAGAVASVAFDAALTLVGQRLVGAGTRASAIEEGWNRVLTAVAAHVAAEPVRVIGAVCNALHQISSVAGARPSVWIERMASLGSGCRDVEDLLRLGQVAAWCSGLAHFRAGALVALAGLPAPVACAVVGAPSGAVLDQIRARLEADPWFDPARAGGRPGKAPAVGVGAFRGFGGLFLEPPIVAAVDEELVVRSGDEYWLLMADAFGATFHRVSAGTFPPAGVGVDLPPGIEVPSGAELEGGRLPGWGIHGTITSVAVTRTTVAITSALTHGILLLARSPVS